MADSLITNFAGESAKPIVRTNKVVRTMTVVSRVPVPPSATNSVRLKRRMTNALPAQWAYRPDYTLPQRPSIPRDWVKSGTTNTFRSNDGNRTWTEYKHVREPGTIPR
jgi:hypothetical protein